MIDWQEMLTMHQELNQFSRVMLTKQQKEFLTSSERELLAWIYLTPDNCTPLHLSKVSGMKKEAVSRCLKVLYKKGCIQRQKNSVDKRSYTIHLTEDGKNALQNDFQIMLQKFYDLYRQMGSEFEELFQLISKANQLITDNNWHKGEENEIL